ncbi:CHAT domain-containing protein [Streptomyces sp. NPDC059063]|uniref:CHAT domain-containing protein n=1 Tax=unclassified Streptomyces TaxID=2593676 RepID=UPI0036AF82E8
MADTRRGIMAGGAGDSHEQLIRLLLTEQRGIDPAPYLSGRTGSRSRTTGPRSRTTGSRDIMWGGWLAPAAALAAGEPKRALSLLERRAPAPLGHAPLDKALRGAATAMEHNWHPGAMAVAVRQEALRELMDASSGMTAAIASITDRNVRLCAALAGQVGVELLSARATLAQCMSAIAARDDTLRHGARAPWTERELADDVLQPLEWFDELEEALADPGHAGARAYHLLLAADLRARVDKRAEAMSLLRRAKAQRTGDPAAEGFTALLEGDWRLGTAGAAEQCTIPPAAQAWDVPAAAEHYERAAASYRAAGSSRGQAAALLRLAHTHRLAGERARCHELLSQALDLAGAAGDGACTALLRVHQALDLIEAEQPGQGEHEAAEQVLTWAATEGSASWLRGLRHVVEGRARQWSAQGEIPKSHRAALLANRLTGEPAGRPAQLTARAAADTYRHASHRLAAFVYTGMRQQEYLDRIDRLTRRGRPLEQSDCLGVIQCAKALHDEAFALQDPDLIAATRSSTQRAIDIGKRFLDATDATDATGTSDTTGTTDTTDAAVTDAAAAALKAAVADAVRDVLGMLARDLLTSRAQETWYRSRRARSAGFEEEADLHARQTLREAERITDPLFAGLVRCSAHVDLRDGDAARAEVAAIEEHLSAIQAAALWLTVGEPERAAPHMRRIGVAGPGPAQPWELPALHADVELERRAYDKAASHARRGLAAYEERRVRLARDALRASSADDAVVAGLYHAAVLSLLKGGGTDAAAASFDQAERSRAGFLDAVRALDRAGADPAAHAAVRTWLAAEIRWSAQFETEAAAVRRGTVTAPAPERKRRIEEAERDLDAAESAVRGLVPRAFIASRATEPPDAAAVAAALPPDTVLLTYHLHDDDFVGWAMTRDTLRAQDRVRWSRGTVAGSRRFHAWCSGRAGDGEADGPELAALLLEPFRKLLRDRHHVVVVPPAGLALLPFHALPWNGDLFGAVHEVSYLPAASLVPRLSRKTPEQPWSRLDTLLVGAPASSTRHGLAALPGTAAETVEIAGLLPRHRLLTGTGASRKAVLEAARGCGLIHLATHGLVDDLAPHRSRLQLAGDDHFGLADLLDTAHAPQLLTLSACDTGRGRATAGGDVLGLTRAALITGARHTLVSLWPVHDSTGCLVITRTYRRLAADPAVRVGTALREAQLAVRDLPGAERDEEFRTLCDRAGVRPGPAHRSRHWPHPGMRDSEQLGVTDQDHRHPSHWAPFIHVGM